MRPLTASRYIVRIVKINSMAHWAVVDETARGGRDSKPLKIFPHEQWDEAQALAKKLTKESVAFTEKMNKALERVEKKGQ